MKVRLRDLLDEAIESGLRGFFNRVNKHSRYIKWERIRYVGNAFVYEKVPEGEVDRHIAEVVQNAMRRITESIDERFTFHDEEPIPICPHCGEPFKLDSDEQNSQG
jgi:hypothetical protein